MEFDRQEIATNSDTDVVAQKRQDMMDNKTETDDGEKIHRNDLEKREGVKTEIKEDISFEEPEVVDNILQFVKIEIDDEDSEFENKKLSEVLHKSKSLKRVKEKNELCEFCNKSFAYKCDLIRHRRVHTGEKPFKCEECDNSFKYKRSLESHVVLFHTGKGKLHQCDICLKPFGMKQHMVKHRKIHFRKGTEPILIL